MNTPAEFDYRSRKWKHLSFKTLQRAGFRCERFGCGRTADELKAVGLHLVAHHLFPVHIDDYIKYALNPRYLVSVCDECHDAIHNGIKHRFSLQWDLNGELFPDELAEIAESVRKKLQLDSEMEVFEFAEQLRLTEANEQAEERRRTLLEKGVLEDDRYSDNGTMKDDGEDDDAAKTTDPARRGPS